MPDHDTSHERTEHGVHADKVSHERQSNHDHEDHGDDGHLDDEVIVRPANDPRDPAASNGEAKGEKRRRAKNAKKHRSDYNPPLRRQTADKCENSPGGGVIQDRGREDDLAKIAAEIIHLAEHSRDDFDRRNGQRCCEE